MARDQGDGSARTSGSAASAKPGWYPDPSSRHQLRAWDGTAWTEYAKDDANTSDTVRDPILLPYSAPPAPGARAAQQIGCVTALVFLVLSFVFLVTALSGYAPGDVASSEMKTGLWLAGISFVLRSSPGSCRSGSRDRRNARSPHDAK